MAQQVYALTPLVQTVGEVVTTSVTLVTDPTDRSGMTGVGRVEIRTNGTGKVSAVLFKAGWAWYQPMEQVAWLTVETDDIGGLVNEAVEELARRLDLELVRSI